MARYDQFTAPKGGWTEWVAPKQTGYKMACCDCGLVHEVNFRVRLREAQMQFKRANRATAAMRRGKRYAAIRAALKGPSP